jgi:hypothetical protein
MRATISSLDNGENTLWEGEALSASWDGDRGEFVIRGDANSQAFTAVVTSMLEKHKLAIGIEDPEATQLVWRGYVGSAKFQSSEAEQIECSLIVSLDDWYGIFPEYNSFYFC